MKEVCKNCSYWTGVGSDFYMCYCGDCPAKIRDNGQSHSFKPQKRFKIKYYYLKSDHMLACPEYDHEEIVEVRSLEKLDKYITTQKDQMGHYFRKKKSFGFDYISNQGAVKVEVYNPKIKKI